MLKKKNSFHISVLLRFRMYLNSHPDSEVKGVMSMAKVTRCLLRKMRMILAHAKQRNARMFLVVAARVFLCVCY